MPWRVFLLAGFIIVALVFAGSHLNADQIDTYITHHLKKQQVPGLSLAVLHNGKVIKSRGYGLASVELNAPATPRTAYQLASDTKQFTATAIMLLVQDGTVRLSDSITNYLSALPSSWSNITVRHLLTMTSGIKDYLDRVPESAWREDFTRERLIHLMTDLPLDFLPGEEFRYSNSNYVLLAMIIQKVSQRSYDSFLGDRVFGPLGMTATRCDSLSDVITNRAALYEWESNRLVNVRFLNPTLWNNGDGGLISTAMDLAKWDAALYDDRILSASMLAEMWTPVKLNNGKTQPYGFGWDVGELRGHRWVGHGGGRPGASTQITRFLSDRLTVIVLMNGPGNAGDVALHIGGLYIPGLTLSSIKPLRDPDPDMTQRLKQCLFDLAERRDSALIMPEFRQDYAKYKWLGADLPERLSNLKSFTYVTTEKPTVYGPNPLPGVTRFCSYKLVSGDETRFYTFQLTADNHVAWYLSLSD